MFGSDSNDSDDGGKGRREELIRGQGLKERRERAWIGESVVIEGNLTTSEDLTIAGRIEGDVAARDQTVVIAPPARIHGNIAAGRVVVHGTVHGTITAQHRVEVGETGTVHGDTEAPRMAVAEGATLHGRMRVASSSKP